MLFSNPQLKHLNVNMIPSPFDEEDSLSTSLESNASFIQYSQQSQQPSMARSLNTNMLINDQTQPIQTGISGLTAGFAQQQQLQQVQAQQRALPIKGNQATFNRGFAFPSPDRTMTSFSFDPRVLSQPQPFLPQQHQSSPQYREQQAMASPPSVTNTSFFDAAMAARQHPSITKYSQSFDAASPALIEQSQMDDEWRYVIKPGDLAQVEQSLQTLVFKDHVRQQYKQAVRAGSFSGSFPNSPALASRGKLSQDAIDFMDETPDEATVFGTSNPSSIMGWDALQQEKSVNNLSSSPPTSSNNGIDGLKNRQRAISLFSKSKQVHNLELESSKNSISSMPSSFPLSTFHVASDPMHSIPEVYVDSMDMDTSGQEDADDEESAFEDEEDVFKFDSDPYSPKPKTADSHIDILVQEDTADDDGENEGDDSVFEYDDDDEFTMTTSSVRKTKKNNGSSAKSAGKMEFKENNTSSITNAARPTKGRKKQQPVMVPLTHEQQQSMVLKLLSNQKKSKSKSTSNDDASSLFASSAPAAIVMDKTASALLSVPPGPLVIHPVSPRGPAAAKANRSSGDKGGFSCDLCGATFSRNHDLKRHIRIHLGIRPFTCNLCLKTFTRRDALEKHSSNCKSTQKSQKTSSATSTSNSSRHASPFTGNSASAVEPNERVTAELIRQSIDKVRTRGT